MTGAAVIGGGPAGLMAAEVLAGHGLTVTVYDRMPSVGRKLLMAGRGGLNLTHSEPLAALLARYGAARAWLEPAIRAFPPEALTAWCHGLGQPTFVGSSGRVFPIAMKASPLLRAWLGRLDVLGVRLRPRHRWSGWLESDGAGNSGQGSDGQGSDGKGSGGLGNDGPRNDGPGNGGLGHNGPVTSRRGANTLCFDGPDGAFATRPSVAILALGGASWPRLGSDGAWTAWVTGTTPLRPSNCGFDVAWPAHFRDRFAGSPLKRIALTFQDRTVRGEATIAATGLEGGAVYALSGPIRDAIAASSPATVFCDLRPDLSLAELAARLAVPRRGQSLPGFLRKHAGLTPEAIGLVQEALHTGAAPSDLPRLIKALPLVFLSPRPIARAISSAGGLRIGPGFMLPDRPGVFAAGEMLDWEAPTGGYLLQACFSTGAAAAHEALAWLDGRIGVAGGVRV